VFVALAVMSRPVVAALTGADDDSEAPLDQARNGFSAHLSTGVIIGACSAAVFAAGAVVGLISTALSGLVMLAGGVALIYLSVRWIFAPMAAELESLSGMDAYLRSAENVSGRFWPTLALVIVAGIVCAIPAGIIAAILMAVVPGSGIDYLVGATVAYALALPFIASVICAAWLDLTGRAGSEHEHEARAEQPPAAEDFE
jgi:hypothetical protein